MRDSGHRGWRGGGLAAAVGLALALAGCAAAPSAPPPGADAAAPAASLPPEVSDALRRMSAGLAAAQGFSVRVHTLRDGKLPNGQRILLGGTAAVTARRPDRLQAVVGSDLGSFALWYDGQQATVLNTAQNVYSSTPLTGPLEQAVLWLEQRLGLELPVRPLLAADPYAAMMEAGPTTGVRVGASFVGDTPVEHFALRSPVADWEIWIESGPRALPRRVSLALRGDPDGARAVLELDQWNLAPRLTDRVFAFTPPPGAVAATPLLLTPTGERETPR